MGRMKTVAGAVMALALVAAPALAQGGQGRGGMDGRGMRAGGPAGMERNPAEFVLQHRADLALTAEQVGQLEAIQARVQQENGPRWEQLRAVFGERSPADMSVEERQQLRDRMGELQPVREEIRATNRAAGEQIHAILTDEQDAKLRPMMQRGNRGDRGDRPARGHRGKRGGQGGGPIGG